MPAGIEGALARVPRATPLEAREVAIEEARQVSSGCQVSSGSRRGGRVC